MSENIILGIDVGGSGVKGALVDLEKGQLKGERYRVPTPKPATPENVAEAFAEIVDYFEYKGLVGVGFPAIVKHGIARSAANIDATWINTDIEKVFGEASDCQIIASNDADVAAVAEMHFGAGKDSNGVVMMLTIGTGIGSALFNNKVLIPNTEMGHLIWPKKDIAERYVSSSAREKAKISRKVWAKRFNEYLIHLERLFSPDLFILGGGESKQFDKFKDVLKIDTPVVAAKLLNNAGIIGAAMHANINR